VNFLSLIEAKRDGHSLDPVQLKEAVSAYTVGTVPDYQMAAFLMAVYFRGLNEVETCDGLAQDSAGCMSLGSFGGLSLVDGWRRLLNGRAGRLTQESRSCGEKCKRQQNDGSFHERNLHGEVRISAIGLNPACSCGGQGSTTKLRHQPSQRRLERRLQGIIP